MLWDLSSLWQECGAVPTPMGKPPMHILGCGGWCCSLGPKGLGLSSPRQGAEPPLAAKVSQHHVAPGSQAKVPWQPPLGAACSRGVMHWWAQGLRATENTRNCRL